MTRAIRGFNKGRLRIWWIHHRRDAIGAAQLTAIIAIVLLVGHFDYIDQIEAEKSARRDVIEQLRQEKAARGLARTTFIIEASTPAEAQEKLAIVAGDADAQRYRLWTATK